MLQSATLRLLDDETLGAFEKPEEFLIKATQLSLSQDIIKKYTFFVSLVGYRKTSINGNKGLPTEYVAPARLVKCSELAMWGLLAGCVLCLGVQAQLLHTLN